MTAADLLAREPSNVKPRTGVIITTTSDTVDLVTPAIKLVCLTAGTCSVKDINGTTVSFLAADIVAMGGVIDFPVTRIMATGTGGTRWLAYL